jgi:hypothetical protein
MVLWHGCPGNGNTGCGSVSVQNNGVDISPHKTWAGGVCIPKISPVDLVNFTTITGVLDNVRLIISAPCTVPAAGEDFSPDKPATVNSTLYSLRLNCPDWNAHACCLKPNPGVNQVSPNPMGQHSLIIFSCPISGPG